MLLAILTAIIAAATAVFAIYDMFRIVQKISQVPPSAGAERQRRLGPDLRAERRRPGDLDRDRAAASRSDERRSGGDADRAWWTDRLAGAGGRATAAGPRTAGPWPCGSARSCPSSRSVTLSPGWYSPMALVRSLDELIVVPPSEVITSPWARPASWAGPLVTTPATEAPDADDARCCRCCRCCRPKKPPKPPPPLSPL